jgi:hypothetical protein
MSSVKQMAWKGPEIDWRQHGLHVFTQEEIAEIDAALAVLRDAGQVDLPEITPARFPLDRVGPLMTGLRRTLRTGPGFVMLRGLPRERYSADDMARIYFGLGSYLGVPKVQSYLGDILGHVINVAEVEPKSRGYRKGGELAMHVDSVDLCDVVALMCLRRSVSGGASRIASALAIRERLQATRPDLLEVLERGFFFRRSTEDGRRAGRFLSPHRIPAFAETEGEVSCYFLPSYAIRAEAEGELKLTDIEWEAIQAVEKLATSEEFYLDMDFDEGDIQFLNNRTILHGRTNYVDDKPLERRRHLLRLWLQVPDWPALPQAQRFSTTAEQAMWAEGREPMMEMPSVHLRELNDRLRALSAA